MRNTDRQKRLRNANRKTTMRWSRVMGWELSMKRILIAAALALAAGGQALAADLPQPAPPPPRAPATYVPVPAPVFTCCAII